MKTERGQRTYVPVYDKTEKKIISLSTGKSVDMTDINHGLKLNRIIERENRFQNLQTRLNEQTNYANWRLTLQDYAEFCFTHLSRGLQITHASQLAKTGQN